MHGESLPNLDSAAQYLSEQAFELVVFYIEGPDRTGSDALEELCRDGTTQPPKLVAVSDPAFTGAEDAVRKTGFDAFLIRPLIDRQLVDLIERLLGVHLNHLAPSSMPAGSADRSHWPAELANDTARRICAAVDVGDVASLFQLTEELADNPFAPAADVDNMASMARLFDFDGLRQLSARLQAGPIFLSEQPPSA